MTATQERVEASGRKWWVLWSLTPGELAAKPGRCYQRQAEYMAARGFVAMLHVAADRGGMRGTRDAYRRADGSVVLALPEGN
jgi:hypothetical protein